MKVFKSGLITVPAALISSYLTNLPSEKNLILEVFQGNLRVVGSKSSTVMKVMPYDEFPSIPSIDGGKTLLIDTKEIIKGFTAVSGFTIHSSVKPELSSVLVYTESDWIYFVATDSFRLGEKKIKLKKHTDFHALVPARNIPDIVRILTDAGDTTRVSFNEHQISFSCGAVYMVSRLSEGTFPDYKQIIPSEHATTVVVLREDILQTFKALSVFSDKFNQLHVDIFPREKRFDLSTKNSDLGESHHSVQSTLNGEMVEVNFNLRYLLDCMPVFETDSISLEFNGAGKPLLLRGVGDSTFLYLVMPMNK